MSQEVKKTLVQCDFDGTVTHADVSYMVLDTFADGDWRKLLDEYRAGRITVGEFNTRAFAMVKADRKTLLDFIKGKVEVRAGFSQLLDYCQRRDFKFVIVSNGLDFYIEDILKELGVPEIEVLAARTEFDPEGVRVRYIGPDGNQLQSDFKEAYIRLFLSQGYRVIYIGNGVSDLSPARKAHHIFATGDLLDGCRQIKINCAPFHDLADIIKGIELLDGIGSS